MILEHMHDHGAEIDQGPAAIYHTLLAQGLYTLGFELVGHVIGNGRHLTIGKTAGYHEVIGYGGTVPQIQDHYVFSLFL